MTEQLYEAGPPPLGDVNHPTLEGHLDILYRTLAMLDPRLANEPQESAMFLGVVDAGTYVSHSLDAETQNTVKAVYDVVLRDVASIPRDQLTLWEQDVAERALHDVTWRNRLLNGPPTDQPINASFSSLQNRILIAARGLGGWPFVKTENYLDFQHQLRAVPRAFGQVTRALQAGVDNHDTMPLAVAEEIVNQLDSVLDGPPDRVASQFYPPGFPEQTNIIERYDQDVRGPVLRSYSELRDYMKRGYLPHCVPSPTSNRFHGERYEMWARYYTDDENRTPESLGPLALDWVESAWDDLRTIRRDEFPEVPKDMEWSDFFAIIRKGLRSHPPTEEEVEAEYERLQGVHFTNILPRFPAWVARTLDQYPLEIRMDTSKMADTSFPIYQQPSLYYGSESRPAVFTEPVTDLGAYNWTGMGRRLSHQGPLGHHIHFLAAQLQMSLPLYLRRVALHPLGLKAYVKYVESLSEKDRWQRAEAAITRLHEGRLSRMDYLCNVVGMPDAELEEEQRAMGGSHPREGLRVKQDQAQYFIFQLGLEKLLAEKRDAQSELGSDFSEPEFHDLALREGPLPPRLLARRARRWIRAKTLGRG